MNWQSLPASTTPTVAVVGCGFSGTMVALHLACRSAGSLRILIFERGERLGRGLAYGTSSPDHLLNVPARLMSAWPDEPDHFLNWLRARDPAAQSGSFAPRRLYGEYLEESLRDAITSPRSPLVPLRAEIVDLIEARTGNYTLVSGEGGRIEADAVVLALGNPGPRDPVPVPDSMRGKRAYISNPWTDDPLGDLEAGDPILLIGSGLTAVDLIVEAQGRAKVGTITVVSRHGLLPRAHAAAPATPCCVPALDRDRPLTARRLLRRLREEVQRSEGAGGDWRGVIDALRPDLPRLWKALDDAEKGRFLRHLLAYWDVHRHRLAPEIDAIIQCAFREGRLSLHAGRIRSMSDHRSGVSVCVSRRGSSTCEWLLARRVINCTGPSKDVRFGSHPLLGALVARGMARPDPLGLGLEVDEKGMLASEDVENRRRIFALGPVLKGQLWETTAVHELRQQAADIARSVVEVLMPGPGASTPEAHRDPAARRTPVLRAGRWPLPASARLMTPCNDQ
jgi:uncharacterized NAD(P)/FAD-binding protein YdhS